MGTLAGCFHTGSFSPGDAARRHQPALARSPRDGPGTASRPVSSHHRRVRSHYCQCHRGRDHGRARRAGYGERHPDRSQRPPGLRPPDVCAGNRRWKRVDRALHRGRRRHPLGHRRPLRNDHRHPGLGQPPPQPQPHPGRRGPRRARRHPGPPDACKRVDRALHRGRRRHPLGHRRPLRNDHRHPGLGQPPPQPQPHHGRRGPGDTRWERVPARTRPGDEHPAKPGTCPGQRSPGVYGALHRGRRRHPLGHRRPLRNDHRHPGLGQPPPQPQPHHGRRGPGDTGRIGRGHAGCRNRRQPADYPTGSASPPRLRAPPVRWRSRSLWPRSASPTSGQEQVRTASTAPVW